MEFGKPNKITEELFTTMLKTFSPTVERKCEFVPLTQGVSNACESLSDDGSRCLLQKGHPHATCPYMKPA